METKHPQTLQAAQATAIANLAREIIWRVQECDLDFYEACEGAFAKTTLGPKSREEAKQQALTRLNAN